MLRLRSLGEVNRLRSQTVRTSDVFNDLGAHTHPLGYRPRVCSLNQFTKMRNGAGHHLRIVAVVDVLPFEHDGNRTIEVSGF